MLMFVLGAYSCWLVLYYLFVVTEWNKRSNSGFVELMLIGLLLPFLLIPALIYKIFQKTNNTNYED